MDGHSKVSGYSQSAHASWAKGGVTPLLGSNGDSAALEGSSMPCCGHQTQLLSSFERRDFVYFLFS